MAVRFEYGICPKPEKGKKPTGAMELVALVYRGHNLGLQDISALEWAGQIKAMAKLIRGLDKRVEVYLLSVSDVPEDAREADNG